MVNIAYIGNFTAPWCTENHVRRALELNGHTVHEVQENEPPAFARTDWSEFDLVLWTRTWPLMPEPKRALRVVKGRIPIVGYHLDRWWGLKREQEITSQRSEFFDLCDVLCTADGGHDELWAGAGITHWWYPPGVLGEEAALNAPALWIDGGAPDIVFVGSHKGYHPEWAYRQQLVEWLRATYGNRVAFFPGERTRDYEWRGAIVRSQQVREVWLNALYQHTPVVVGDSCLAGAPSRYWSDRVPETIGRGGLLIHPHVDGGVGAEHLLGGIDLFTYEVGDFGALRRQIDFLLGHPEIAETVRRDGRAKVLKFDTYEVRMATLVAELDRVGMI